MTDQIPVTDESEPGVEQYRAAVRRAPKLGVFLGLGGVLGAIVAGILTAAQDRGTSQAGDAGAISDNGLWVVVVFFFSIAIGMAVGAVVALILDRASRRRTAIITVERGVVETEWDEDQTGATEEEPGNAGAGNAEPGNAGLGHAEPGNADAATGSEVAENSSPDVGGRA